MSLKIRTKLIIAFFAIIFPLFFIIGIIGLYNHDITRKSLSHVESMFEERLEISNLMFALERIVMHGNDYIITADRKYIESFAEAADRTWRKSLVIMFAGGGILIALGVFFSFVYSIWFVKPIEIIHRQAESIAEGNFKVRLDIKTGDEIEQLSNAMNEMAAQLDSFYSNLQGMVDERTRELRENVKRYSNTLNNMLEGCQIIDFEWT